MLLLLIVFSLLPEMKSQAQEFPDVCRDSENILRNCGFDEGFAHWNSFIEAGSADFDVLQGGGECHAPLCPAGYILTRDHFVGGIYQQVPVTQGQNYYANIVWLAFDALVNDASINKQVGGIGRRIGIDPFGGTDSQSPNIIWSEDNWRNDCKICNVEHVTATAQADTITLFLRIEDLWRLRASEKGYPIPPSKDQFWIDDLGLKPVGGEPIAVQAAEPTEEPPTETPPPPTDTPVPESLPTEAPVPEPADDTPTPEPEVAVQEVGVQMEQPQEAEPTEEPTDEPDAPSDTPTTAPSTNTPIPPPPTLTPTQTPPATSTPVAVSQISAKPRPTLASLRTSTSETANSPRMLNAIGTMGCIGGLGLSFAGVVVAGLVWLYRLGWGNSEDD